MIHLVPFNQAKESKIEPQALNRSYAFNSSAFDNDHRLVTPLQNHYERQTRLPVTAMLQSGQCSTTMSLL
jgi:hypothetical protein